LSREALWQRHEREVAEAFHGQVTVGSGALIERLDVDMPRDGSLWRMLLECKSTSAKSYGVKQTLLEEIRQRTYERSAEMRPGFALRFYGEDIGPNTRILEDWVALPLHDMAELLDERRRLQERVEELERMDIGP